MKFALLGNDPAVLPLVRFLIEDAAHSLSLAANVDGLAEELQSIDTNIVLVEDWLGFQDDPSLETILVAGQNETVLDAAKRLAADGKSLLLFPRAAQLDTFIYEVSLARDDNPVVLAPVFPLRVHPQISQLRNLMNSGGLGSIRYLQLETEVQPAAQSSAHKLLEHSEIDDYLLPDADLLRFLCGEYTQVTTLLTGRTDAGVAMAQVTLSGGTLPEATWTCKPAGDSRSWKLTVCGESATAVLEGTDENELTLDLNPPGNAVNEPSPDESHAETWPKLVLESYLETCAGENSIDHWAEMTHAFEILDASRRSIRRRRTVDLYRELPSERSQFKTQMTAIGCTAMMLTMGLLVAVLMAGTLLEISSGMMQVLRVLVFLPVFLFLALQALIVYAKPAADKKAKP